MQLRMKILQSKITRTQTSFSTNADGKLSFILYFLSASTATTIIFTSIITLEPCGLNAQTFHISYRDLIKFHYFVDPSERGDRGGRQGDFRDNFTVNIKTLQRKLELCFFLTGTSSIW